jgi:hypothetical protein
VSNSTKRPHPIKLGFAPIASFFALWLLPRSLAVFFSRCKKKSRYRPGQLGHSQ